MSIFKDKVLLITGGTGSFGNAVLNRFLESDLKDVLREVKLALLEAPQTEEPEPEDPETPETPADTS